MAAPNFHPHYNRATGRYYHTKADYYGDLKAKGLQPYDPSAAKEPQRKPYVESAWARDMQKAIKNSKGRVGGVVIDQLKKRGMDITTRRADLPTPDRITGEGFYDAEKKR